MFSRSVMFFLLAIMFAVGTPVAFSQGADNKGSMVPKTGEDDSENHPKSFRETLFKLRIDQEKKEFGQMLERGEEALKLSEELEKAYSQNGRLNPQEITKLIAVEKLVKKIRSELGGDDDGSEENSGRENFMPTQPLAQGDAVKSFGATTRKLFEELKKTSRFTVSAAAIQTSNAVLKLAKLLKISR